MRLPINFLLYLASAAMLGWAGWLFVQATVHARPPQESSKEGFDAANLQIEAGRGLDQREQGWNYENKEWWLRFKEVNLTGEVPPQEIAPVEPHTDAVANEPEKPLDEIFLLISLMYHNVANETEAHVVVRYQDDAEVEVPESVAALQAQLASRGMPAVPARQLSGRRVGQRARPLGGQPRGVSPQPLMNLGQNLPMHHVKLGESLWEPYDHIELVSVAEDARSAFFLRSRVEAAVGEEPRPEEVFKNEMNLDPELVRMLVEEQRGARGVAAREAPRSQPISSWRDVPETTQVSPGRFIVSRSDDQLIREDPQKLLDQVTIRPYRSKTGDRSRNGVQLVNVSPELGRRFGVRSGDVILEVNGIPVTSRSKAIEVGTKQYKTGVREFRVRIMTMGRIEERTYTAPDAR